MALGSRTPWQAGSGKPRHPKHRLDGRVAAVAAVLFMAAVAGLVAGRIRLPLALHHEPALARPPAARVELLVSAAASLTDVVQELARAFEASHPAVRILTNTGSSGHLQRQIELGAAVDVFISVSREIAEELAGRGLLDGRSLQAVAGNVLVLVRPSRPRAASLKTWADLANPSVRRVALGDPAHVPAGQYARAVLQRLGLWQAVAPKLVYGEDVRQVLHYVAAAEVDAGIVYATDAASTPRVTVVAPAPKGSHPPVLYVAGVVAASRHPQLARAFVEFLAGEQGQAIFARFGFVPVVQAATRRAPLTASP